MTHLSDQDFANLCLFINYYLFYHYFINVINYIIYHYL